MLLSDNMADVLDPRFRRFFDEGFRAVSDYLDRLYYMDSGSKPGRNTERYSNLGAYGEIQEFTGNVNYDDVYQGYDSSLTPKEFAAGIQIERKLFDDDQHNLINAKPKSMSASLSRLRMTHAARPWNSAFSVDTYFGTNTENVAMCSNSHTTTSGASTATGFDNLTTAAMSAVSVAAMRLQMRGFRGDRAERINVIPTGLLYPIQLEETAFEISKSQGKTETAYNNASFMKDRFEDVIPGGWQYLTSSNDYFMVDRQAMTDGYQGLVWLDRTKGEMAFVEDFETLIAKWRIYARWGNVCLGWRFVAGADV